jgi:phospholipid/cholesterol/gamma-HCH transport system permease protein
MGGGIVSVYNSDISISFTAYFGNLSEMVDFMDLLNGMVKSFGFAVVIGLVSCQQGFDTHGGPRGIGRSVTKSVVNSIVTILILDYFLTRLLMFADR